MKLFNLSLAGHFINLYLVFQGQKQKILNRRVATSSDSSGTIEE